MSAFTTPVQHASLHSPSACTAYQHRVAKRPQSSNKPPQNAGRQSRGGPGGNFPSLDIVVVITTRRSVERLR